MLTNQKRYELKCQAIQNLAGIARFYIEGEPVWEEVLDSAGNSTDEYVCKNLHWIDQDIPIPSKTEVDAEYIRLEQEWIATEYRRQRIIEYPPLSELADAIYWQAQGDESKMAAYLAAVDAVKAKYPKAST